LLFYTFYGILLCMKHQLEIAERSKSRWKGPVFVLDENRQLLYYKGRQDKAHDAPCFDLLLLVLDGSQREVRELYKDLYPGWVAYKGDEMELIKHAHDYVNSKRAYLLKSFETLYVPLEIELLRGTGNKAKVWLNTHGTKTGVLGDECTISEQACMNMARKLFYEDNFKLCISTFEDYLLTHKRSTNTFSNVYALYSYLCALSIAQLEDASNHLLSVRFEMLSDSERELYLDAMNAA
jgi:hypothetical protein